ncbi:MULTISPECIES: hypothetical protein [Pectobacterium]|uniref:hypothetical protein n=1 Tax=Pectobacterium TaxID=122277 RepID=UPI001CF429A8|nr:MULTISPECIES: hypothetical protein [Pectobacterium]MCA6927769.1 hypothetical protein [Pectobacterium versatile]MCH5051176.1 hypothetical protein [Pectobacterium aquaticum]MCH5084515.1 hypothetical protein [Pectobacterium versatile]
MTINDAKTHADFNTKAQQELNEKMTLSDEQRQKLKDRIRSRRQHRAATQEFASKTVQPVNLRVVATLRQLAVRIGHYMRRYWRSMGGHK